MVWATRRCSESYRLVWAVTVVRPRCSGTATARTAPLLTGRNSWLVEVIVAVGMGEPHHLLESLAHRMADAVRAKFPAVRQLRLELRKLNPPTCPGHPAFAAVRLVRGPEST